ncbi:flagellar basal body-associated FliL family protein [Desulfohalobiaceae bacterium Ax17]|uniref:flagellar basal body-associated FliL family protein n=1 Tax=Desulfovulcanus ferrireducens TaxID=2831190 RepID=UPI00207BA9CC|nr:flagellar basal body-associated FliL family protein [Desulfovulcanus ferrireducens]MBT8763640.1 flagellar basal body-associated FliL family protein [Desulfovulcanus ferrireducens]
MAKKKKDQEQTEEKKKGGILKWIILLVLLIILGVGGFFGYKYFFAGPKDKVEAEGGAQPQGEQQAQQEKQPAEQGPTEMYSLPPFVVNLADPLGRRYLKLSLDVELIDKKTVEVLEKKLPKVKDTILLLLSSKSFADIDSMEEKIQLKNEIVERLNQILGKAKVVRVYFTEFVVQ